MSTQTQGYWGGFIKAAQHRGLDNLEIIGLYTVKMGGQKSPHDAPFFDLLEKMATDISDLNYIKSLIAKSSECGPPGADPCEGEKPDAGHEHGGGEPKAVGTPMQNSHTKEDNTLDMMRETRSIQGGEQKGTPMQDSEAKEVQVADMQEAVQGIQFEGKATPEADDEMRNRGAGTDKKAEAYREGFNSIMRKVARQGGEGGMALMGALGQGAARAVPGGGTGMHHFGQGMRDMGLAALAEKDPKAAILARGRLQGETGVEALGPFEGWIPGAMAGAGVGGTLGALAGGQHGGLEAAGMGLGGAALGGLMGGGLHRAITEEQIRSQAYKSALERHLKAMEASQGGRA